MFYLLKHSVRHLLIFALLAFLVELGSSLLAAYHTDSLFWQNILGYALDSCKAFLQRVL
jgi:hypothetical protein